MSGTRCEDFRLSNHTSGLTWTQRRGFGVRACCIAEASDLISAFCAEPPPATDVLEVCLSLCSIPRERVVNRCV